MHLDFEKDSSLKSIVLHTARVYYKNLEITFLYSTLLLSTKRIPKEKLYCILVLDILKNTDNLEI